MREGLAGGQLRERLAGGQLRERLAGGRLRERLVLADSCMNVLSSAGHLSLPRAVSIEEPASQTENYVKSCTRERERLGCWCSGGEILTFQPPTATDP